MEKKNDQSEAEFAAFFPEERFIQTLSGERLKIPLSNWRKEARGFKLLGRLLSKIAGSRKVNFDEITADRLFEILPEILAEAPDEAEEAAMLVLDKDQEWIRENLDTETLLEVILPFFVLLWKKLQRGFKKVERLIKK